MRTPPTPAPATVALVTALLCNCVSDGSEKCLGTEGRCVAHSVVTCLLLALCLISVSVPVPGGLLTFQVGTRRSASHKHSSYLRRYSSSGKQEGHQPSQKAFFLLTAARTSGAFPLPQCHLVNWDSRGAGSVKSCGPDSKYLRQAEL